MVLFHLGSLKEWTLLSELYTIVYQPLGGSIKHWFYTNTFASEISTLVSTGESVCLCPVMANSKLSDVVVIVTWLSSSGETERPIQINSPHSTPD